MSKSKINLIIFHPYSDIGGADLSLSRLINNLDRKKYEIDFICLNKQKIRKYLKEELKYILSNHQKQFFQFLRLEELSKKT